MQLKSFPTDSLYKFVTLFFLVLLVSTIIGTASLTVTSKQEQLETKEYIDRLEAKKKVLNDKDELTVTNAKIDSAKERLRIEESWYDNVVKAGVFVSLLSLFLSGLGFLFWDRNLQRYINEKIKLENQLLLAQIENQKLENEALKNK